MTFELKSPGNFNKTTSFLEKLLHRDHLADLNRWGQIGVESLSRMTPVETGESARSWGYRVINTHSHVAIEWYNTNLDGGGTPVVILIQYGHGTGTGGYVSGRDFINPAMRPVFDQIADDMWKKVRT